MYNKRPLQINKESLIANNIRHFRWLSHKEFLETFIHNYEFYVKIRDDEPDLFSPHEKNILDNRQVKEGAAHMLSQLNLVSQSLNLMQSDTANLGDALNSWIMLSTSPILSDELKLTVKQRMDKAITPWHILAKMILNKAGCALPVELKAKAVDYVESIDESFPGILAAFEIQDNSIFPASAFMNSIKDILEPVKYWRYVSLNTELEPLKRFCDFAIRLLSCPPSSAGLL